jgi:hypothetical protein
MAGKVKAAVFSLLMALAAGLPAAAQVPSVSYLEGAVSLHAGAAWKELSIGDSIPVDSTVRVAEHAYLELSAGSVRVTLSQPGTYPVRSVLAAALSLRSAGAGKALTAMMSRMVSGSPSKQGTAGGVRAEQIEAPAFEYETGEVSVLLREAKDFIASGRFDSAIERLEKAVAEADGTEIAEARYCLAQAYSMKGDTRNALAQAAGVHPLDSDPWRPDFVLLKGRVLFDASAFDQAVQWLLANGQAVATDGQRTQTYFFLLGLAYGGTGDLGKEKQCLARVISASADDELGQAAAKLVSGL